MGITRVPKIPNMNCILTGQRKFSSEFCSVKQRQWSLEGPSFHVLRHPFRAMIFYDFLSATCNFEGSLPPNLKVAPMV